MRKVGQYVGFLLIGLGASVAHAGPIVTTTSGTTTPITGVTTVDFTSGCTGYATCSGDFEIVAGRKEGKYAEPFSDSGNYLTVPRPSAITDGKNPFSATLYLGNGVTANYFGLFWGSLDSYNTIAFLMGNTVVASFTGSDIAKLGLGLVANGNQSAPASNAYLNFFFGSDVFNAVRLTSTQFAFERATTTRSALTSPSRARLRCSASASLASPCGAVARPPDRARHFCHETPATAPGFSFAASAFARSRYHARRMTPACAQVSTLG